MKDILRTALERFGRERILKRKIRIKGKSVPLFVSPDAQLKYLKLGSNSFDADLINIAERFLSEKSNVWDIGANIGVFAFAAASIAHAGTVLAVEADIWLAHLLQKSARIPDNTEYDIRVLPVAVSSENGFATFNIAKRGRASNALEKAGGRSQMGGVREKQLVPTTTLDILLSSFPHPDFVKIDVEGAELMTLQGAKQLINEIRPIFYIEVGKNVAEQIYSLFREENYHAYDGKSKTLINGCSPNTYFIPSENINAQKLIGAKV